jgi:exodeoxyribonuclease-5
MIQLIPEQEQLVNQLLIDIRYHGVRPYGKADFFYKIICGYAGTGKTTVICELKRKITNEDKYLSISFLTYTGKASSVLKTKLEENKLLTTLDFCGTIHGFIYKPKTYFNSDLNQHVIIGWERRPKNEVHTNLIIIDEASMISKEIWKDLLYYEIPIIVFGDHGQLPPIDDNFNLLEKPDYILTQIHRQALNSPIIKLSSFIRKEGYIPFGKYSNEVFKLSWRQPQCQQIWNNINYSDDDLIVLCAFNKTRSILNDEIRTKLSFSQKQPYPDEKVVCLMNNHDQGIMNGQIGKVVWAMPAQYNDAYRLTINIGGKFYECNIAKQCFGEVQYSLHDYKRKNNLLRNKKARSSLDFFDYGYVISVHKSQGSEWSRVVLFEQRTSKWDDEYYKKWLYTAVTRAKQKLFIITDYFG